MSEEEPVSEREAALGRFIDEMPMPQFMSEAAKLFGARRVMELVGWAVLWGIREDLGIERVSEFRKKLAAKGESLEALGLSESAAYRAHLDFRRLRDHMETLMHRPVREGEVVKLLRQEREA